MDNYFYKNLYEILGLDYTDDISKIKSAYRTLARKYHPDLNGGNKVFTEKFKDISQAYEILIDADKKKLYDTFKGYTRQQSRTTQKQAEKAYSKSQTPPPQKEKSDQSTFSDVLNDIMENLFKDRSNTAKTKKRPENGSDVTSEVTISYQEALMGTSRTVNILHTEICPNCEGKMFINQTKCPLCQGSGETSIHKKINVKIPKNIKQNAKIRIPNEGNRGKNGGKNGDVYLIIKIENDKKYTYDGLNVKFEASIYPQDAVFGTELYVNTPQGKVLMRIPANTSQGQKLRLAKNGLKDDLGNIGDAIVTIRIDIPQELSDKELQLYKQLADIRSTKSKEEKYNGA